MISDRPYRTAMSETDAVEELRRNAGTQFDPRVIEALLGVLHEAGPGDAGRGGTADGEERFAAPEVAEAEAGDLPGDCPEDFAATELVGAVRVHRDEVRELALMPQVLFDSSGTNRVAATKSRPPIPRTRKKVSALPSSENPKMNGATISATVKT